MREHELAQFLGWLSLGIAAAEIFGQGYVERDLLGIDEHPQLMPSLGLREAAAGITILSAGGISRTLAGGLWSRVAGDAMDLALLGVAAASTRKPISFAANALTVLGVTALDIFCASRVQRSLAAQRRTRPAQFPPRRARMQSEMQRMTAGL